MHRSGTTRGTYASQFNTGDGGTQEAKRGAEAQTSSATLRQAKGVVHTWLDDDPFGMSTFDDRPVNRRETEESEENTGILFGIIRTTVVGSASLSLHGYKSRTDRKVDGIAAWKSAHQEARRRRTTALLQQSRS